MSSVVGNIVINVDASSVRGATAAIAGLNRQLATSGAGFAASTGGMQQMSQAASFLNSTGNWSAGIQNVTTQAHAMNKAFDEGKMSMQQWRQTARTSPLLNQMAADRVKMLQTRYAALGKSVDGVQRTMRMTPTGVMKNWNGEAAMAAQKSELLRRRFDMMSKGMINWGKNTQWAGRQLMVGVGVPLAIAGAAAVKSFKEMEEAAISFKRVYGDLDTSDAEKKMSLGKVTKMATEELTKYGIAASDTVDIAARVAATGAEGGDMMAATEETMRLATLGQMDYNTALESTIAVQNAFKVESKDMGRVTDFLNATENQTILAMEDMAKAIPRVGTTIKGLGGDVEDLAVMMTALRAGGVTAEQGANALKSGLASLINPTNSAMEANKKYGISINKIVEGNKGDLTGTIEEYGDALMKLSKFDRQRVLEETFGKYQYARMSALFENMKKDQAQQTKELSEMSSGKLAGIAEGELKTLEESPLIKMQAALEKLKASLVPIGEMIVRAITPVLEFFTKITTFLGQNKTAAKIVLIGAAFLGIIGVVTMLVGVFANLIGTMLRVGAVMKRIFSGGGFRSTAALQAQTAQQQLNNQLANTTRAMYNQAGAANQLSSALQRMATAAYGGASGQPIYPAMGGGGAGGVRASNAGSRVGEQTGWGTPVMQYGAAHAGEQRGYATSGQRFSGPSFADKLPSGASAIERSHFDTGGTKYGGGIPGHTQGQAMRGVVAQQLQQAGLIADANAVDYNKTVKVGSKTMTIGDYFETHSTGKGQMLTNQVLGFDNAINQSMAKGGADVMSIASNLRNRQDTVMAPMLSQVAAMKGINTDQLLQTMTPHDAQQLKTAMSGAATEFEGMGPGKKVGQNEFGNVMQKHFGGAMGNMQDTSFADYWRMSQAQLIHDNGADRQQVSKEVLKAMGVSDVDADKLAKMNYKGTAGQGAALDSAAEAYRNKVGAAMDPKLLTHNERVANQHSAAEYEKQAKAAQEYHEKKAKSMFGRAEDKVKHASRADEIRQTRDAAQSDMKANIAAEQDIIDEQNKKLAAIDTQKKQMIDSVSNENKLNTVANKSRKQASKFEREMMGKYANMMGIDTKGMDKHTRFGVGQGASTVLAQAMNQSTDINKMGANERNMLRNFIASGRPDISAGTLDKLFAENNADNEAIKSLLKMIATNTADDMADAETRGDRATAQQGLQAAQDQKQVMTDIKNQNDQQQKRGFWGSQYDRAKNAAKSTARGYGQAMAGKAKLAYHHRAQGAMAAAGVGMAGLQIARATGAEISPMMDASVMAASSLMMIPGLMTALMNPWGLLIAATIAAVSWFKIMNNKAAEAGEKLAKFNIMTSDTISKMGESFRQQNRAQEILNERLKAIDLKGKDVSKAKKFLETDMGKEFQENYLSNKQAFGKDYADKVLFTNISRAITQKSMNYKNADGLFKAMFGINFRQAQQDFQVHRKSKAGGGGGEFRLMRRVRTGDKDDVSQIRKDADKKAKGWKDLEEDERYWGWHRDPVDQTFKNFKGSLNQYKTTMEEAEKQERSLFENLGRAWQQNNENIGNSGFIAKGLRIGGGLIPIMSMFIGEGDGMSAWDRFNQSQEETVKRRAQMAAEAQQMTKMMYEENLVVQENIKLQDKKLTSLVKQKKQMEEQGQTGTKEYKILVGQIEQLRKDKKENENLLSRMDYLTTQNLKSYGDMIDAAGRDGATLSMADLDQIVETNRTLIEKGVFADDEESMNKFDIAEAIMRQKADFKDIDGPEQQRILANFQQALISGAKMDSLEFMEQMFPKPDEVKNWLGEYSGVWEEVYGSGDLFVGDPMQYFSEFTSETTGGQIQETFGNLAAGFDKANDKGKEFLAQTVFGLRNQKDWKGLSKVGIEADKLNLGSKKQGQLLGVLANISATSKNANRDFMKVIAALNQIKNIDSPQGWNKFLKIVNGIEVSTKNSKDNIKQIIANWKNTEGLTDADRDWAVKNDVLDPSNPNVTPGWYYINGVMVHFDGTTFKVLDPNDPQFNGALAASEARTGEEEHGAQKARMEAERKEEKRKEKREARRAANLTDAERVVERKKSHAQRELKQDVFVPNAQTGSIVPPKETPLDVVGGMLNNDTADDSHIKARAKRIRDLLQKGMTGSKGKQLTVDAIPDMKKFKNSLQKGSRERKIVVDVIRKLKKNKQDDIDKLKKKQLTQIIARNLSQEEREDLEAPQDQTQYVKRQLHPDSDPSLNPGPTSDTQPDEKGEVKVTPRRGGYISGPGTGTSDSIPARISNGEYVIRAKSVDKYGKNFLSAVNRGLYNPNEGVKTFNTGGSADGEDKDDPAEEINKTYKLNEELMKTINRFLNSSNKALEKVVAYIDAGDKKLLNKMKSDSDVLKRYYDNMRKEKLFEAIKSILETANEVSATMISLGKKLQGVKKVVSSNLSAEQIQGVQAIKIPNKLKKKNNSDKKIEKNRKEIAAAEKKRAQLAKKLLDSNIKNFKAEIAMTQKQDKLARQAEKLGISEQELKIKRMLDARAKLAQEEVKKAKKAKNKVPKKKENKREKADIKLDKAKAAREKLQIKADQFQQRAQKRAQEEFAQSVKDQGTKTKNQIELADRFNMQFDESQAEQIKALLDSGQVDAARDLVKEIHANTEATKELEKKMQALEASQGAFDKFAAVRDALAPNLEGGTQSVIGTVLAAVQSGQLSNEDLKSLLTPENLALMNTMTEEELTQFINNTAAASDALEGLKYATMNLTEIGNEIQSLRDEKIQNIKTMAESQGLANFFGPGGAGSGLTVTGADGKVVPVESQTGFDIYKAEKQEEVRLLNKELEDVNEFYEDQQKALEKIGKAQQYIANIERGRLNVASALAKGDMFAAAQAMQQAKAEQASQNLQMAKDALKEEQELRAEAIQDKIEAINDELEELNAQFEEAKREALIKYLAAIQELEKAKTADTSQESYWAAANREIDAAIAKATAYYNLIASGGDPAAAIGAGVDAGAEDNPTDTGAGEDTVEQEDSSAATPNSGQISRWGKWFGKLVGNDKRWLKKKGFTAGPKSTFNKLAPLKAEKAIAKIRDGKLGNKEKDWFRANKMQYGGFVPGFGSTDKVPTMLTPGEFVVRKSSAKMLGSLLSDINKPGYSYASPAGIMGSEAGTVVQGNQTNNYTVTVNAGGVTDAREVADITVRRIKELDARSVRTMDYKKNPASGWR